MNKVIDRRPIIKMDVFRSEDFKAATNCNGDLYTGHRNYFGKEDYKKIRKRVEETFQKCSEETSLKRTLKKIYLNPN